MPVPVLLTCKERAADTAVEPSIAEKAKPVCERRICCGVPLMVMVTGTSRRCEGSSGLRTINLPE